MSWYVYVLNTEKLQGFYVGITQNFLARVERHCKNRGASVLKQLGIADVITCVPIRSKAHAKLIESFLVRALRLNGYLAWGGGRTSLNLLERRAAGLGTGMWKTVPWPASATTFDERSLAELNARCAILAGVSIC